MRYLVKARVKSGREKVLLAAIEKGTLGQGSIAGEEYLHNMRQARVADDCTKELEQRMQTQGCSFLERLAYEG